MYIPRRVRVTWVFGSHNSVYSRHLYLFGNPANVGNRIVFCFSHHLIVSIILFFLLSNLFVNFGRSAVLYEVPTIHTVGGNDGGVDDGNGRWETHSDLSGGIHKNTIMINRLGQTLNRMSNTNWWVIRLGKTIPR